MRDTETFKDLFVTVLYVIFILFLLVGVPIVYGQTTCFSQTADMGFEHRWSYFGGCQIEVEEGQWIPMDRYYFKEE